MKNNLWFNADLINFFEYTSEIILTPNKAILTFNSTADIFASVLREIIEDTLPLNTTFEVFNNKIIIHSHIPYFSNAKSLQVNDIFQYENNFFKIQLIDDKIYCNKILDNGKLSKIISKFSIVL